MSKFKDSVYMPGQRGKIGATVMSRNKYGPYAKINTLPSNPNSIAQLQSRSRMSGLSRQWNFLTEVQRMNWNEQSKNFPVQKDGNVYFSTGKNFFVKFNRIRQEIGEPALLDFPGIALPQSFDHFSVEYINTPAGTDLILNISPPISSATKIRLTATRMVNRGVSSANRRHYKIGILDSSFISGSSIKDLYINKFGGLPPIDKKIFFSMISTDIATAFSSSPLSTRVTREF